MHTTRVSLLFRVRDVRDSEAWEEFAALYQPLILRYVRARGISSSDADDVAQECFAELLRRLPMFEYDHKRGGFRRWLRVFVSFRVRNHVRKRRERVADSGELQRPQFRERSAADVWNRIWLQEHLRYCLEQIRLQVETRTFEAFWRCAIDEQPVDEVCERLGLNANQVYIAKSRVTTRLRDMMTELLGQTG